MTDAPAPRLSRLACASAAALVAAPLLTYALFFAAGGSGQTGWDALGTGLLALFGGLVVLLTGFVSGLVALVRIRRNPLLRGAGWAGIGVSGSALVLAFFVWEFVRAANGG